MRETLANHEGWRGEFHAVFVRYGQKPAFKGPPIRTLLFRDVTTGAGEPMCDHVWFTDCKQWSELKLEPGEPIAFIGRITRYVKGYRGRRAEWDDSLPAPSIDFRISHPTHARRLSTAPVDELPLFSGQTP